MCSRLLYLCLIVIFLVEFTQHLRLDPPEKSYKILMLLPVAPKSHSIIFKAVAEALAQRGHEIEILTSVPGFSSSSPNIKHVFDGLDYDNFMPNMFESRNDPTGGFKLFASALPKMSKSILESDAVHQMYKRRDEFDLIIINEVVNEIMLPFAVNKTLITISPAGINFFVSAIFGNFLNPAFFSSYVKDYKHPYSFLDRLHNLLIMTTSILAWKKLLLTPNLEKLEETFPGSQNILDIERNISLSLMNSNWAFEYPIPLLPSQINIGGIQCRHGKPLPDDLKTWLDVAPEGVIYFSLGSIAKGESIPPEYRVLFESAFKKIKQKVLWKYEKPLEGLSDNILLRKWMPQQDVLAHPNVKLFITHGGLLSTTESLYHSTPMLVLPIFGDQPRNAQRVQHKGFGVILQWEELTVDLIIEKIEEVFTNDKYSTRVSLASRTLHDQPETPAERAVWWVEYVIRTKGAIDLRSPAAELTWIEYLMLDVIFFLISLLSTFALMFVMCLYFTYKKCMKRTKHMESKRKQE